MAPTLPEDLARKQRTTLRGGGTSKLIDLLRAGPTTQFTTATSLAGVRRYAPTQHWKNAFQIGQGSPKPLIGRMFNSMYNNNLTIQDDANWHPVRPLGNGSYGAAALYRHEDELGNTDDFVVTKYTEYRKKDMVKDWDSHISQEAAIMMQLNELDSDGTLFLREFRHFPNIKIQAYFTEYCPNFDMNVLRLTHKAMQRKIPDALLWYFFYVLAKGLSAMEQGPFGNYATPHDHIPGAFLVHRDIKPANTFLGCPSAPSKPLSGSSAGYVGTQLRYPLPKIADFGLSQITTLGSDANIAINHGAGTAWYMPPEMRIHKFKENSNWYPFRGTRYGEDGDPVPEDQPVLGKGFHAYTAAGNVFVVGFMMYQLITLDDAEDMHDFLNAIISQQDEPAPMSVLDPGDLMNRYQLLEEFYNDIEAGIGLNDNEEELRQDLIARCDMIGRWRRTSTAHLQEPVLKQLVESCMRFLPEDRPSASNLLQQLEDIMPSHLQKLLEMQRNDRTAFEDATTAFTTEAQLPSMRGGNLPLSRDPRFWRRLVKSYKWLDLTAGNIRPQMDLNDNDIPDEAKDMFYPGHREERNRVVAERSSFQL